MGSGDLHCGAPVAPNAGPPVDYPIGLGEDRDLGDVLGERRLEVVNTRLRARTPDVLHGGDDEGMGPDAIDGRPQRDDLDNEIGPSQGGSPRKETAKTVTDQPHRPSGLAKRLLDGLQQALREQFRAIGVQADVGEICRVSDPPKPRVELKR